MKLLKSNLKLIIGFLIGVVITGGIVYAATSASQISYTTDKNADIKNVQEALNDLYKKDSSSRKTPMLIKSNCHSDTKTTISVSNIECYQELTKDNFFIVMKKIEHKGGRYRR